MVINILHYLQNTSSDSFVRPAMHDATNLQSDIATPPQDCFLGNQSQQLDLANLASQCDSENQLHQGKPSDIY